jgi:hypothetical protein
VNNSLNMHRRVEDITQARIVYEIRSIAKQATLHELLLLERQKHLQLSVLNALKSEQTKSLTPAFEEALS